MAANNPEIVTPAIFFLQRVMISWLEYVVDCLIEPDITHSINLLTRFLFYFLYPPLLYSDFEASDSQFGWRK